MFPFYHDYPGTDLHEIDLAYILKLCADLKASNQNINDWRIKHAAEYKTLKDQVDALINSLVDVVIPWDSSISYKIFSMVEYQGTNYIAVQDVPVGIMITNTDYWQPANTTVEQINAMAAVVGAISEENNKLIGGKSQPVKEVVKVDYNGLADLQGTYTEYIYLQGGCYDSINDHFILFLVNGTEPTLALGVVLDRSYNVVSRHPNLPLGHANDAAFTPDDGHIFVTCGDTGAYAGQIVELDSTFNVVDYHTIPDTICWRISYDEVNNRFFIDGTGIIRVYDRSLTTQLDTIERLWIYDGLGEYVIQSSFVYKEHFCDIIFTRYLGNFETTYLVNYTKEGSNIMAVYPSINGRDEPECMLMVDGVGYMFGGQSFFTVSKVYFDRNVIPQLNFMNDKTTARRIPSGDDLDDYTTAGVYFIVSGTDAANIANTPQSIGASVVNTIQTQFFIRQEYRTTAGNTYIRIFNTTTKTWTAWNMINMQSNEKTAFSPTAGTGVTLAWSHSGRWAEMVTLAVSITTTAAIAKEARLLSDVPAPYRADSSQVFFQGQDTEGNVILLAISNAGVYAKQAIASGKTIRFILTYIAA